MLALGRGDSGRLGTPVYDASQPRRELLGRTCCRWRGLLSLDRSCLTDHSYFLQHELDGDDQRDYFRDSASPADAPCR